MILFLLKKNFCDGWDNMLSLIVPNVVMTVVAFVLWALYGLLNPSGNLAAGMAFTVILPAVFMIFVFAYGDNAEDGAGERIFCQNPPSRPRCHALRASLRHACCVCLGGNPVLYEYV